MAYTVVMAMNEIWGRRLGNFLSLDPDELGALSRLSDGRVRRMSARMDLVREGEPPQALRLILSGWACRYRTLEDGRRQNLSILLPGDLCDLHDDVLPATDHAIGALTPLQFVEIPFDKLERLIESHPRLGRAFTWHMLTGVSAQREWIVNLSRSSLERLGNLFCELYYRLRAVGLTERDHFDFPMTQIELAGATGLTSVHVNRTLQEMRANQLIVLKNRRLVIPDIAALEHLVLFSRAFLHLDKGMTETGRVPAGAMLLS